MEITILDNLWCETPDHLDEVERTLRWKVKGARFAPSFQKGLWDGYKKMSRRVKTGIRFPVGLLDIVLAQPWAQGAVVTDNRYVPQEAGLHYGEYDWQTNLTPEQIAVVEAGVSAGRGILKAPTGFGKGRIIGETIRRLNAPTLVLVDKKDLLWQLHDTLEEVLDIKVGVVGNGTWDDTSVCVVATIQTVASYLTNDNPEYVDKAKKLLDIFDCVIVDETHHAESDSYETVLKSMKWAYYRLGYSATAFKSYEGRNSDRSTFLKVQAWLGPPVASVSLQEGVDAGRIVPADVFFIKDCTPTLWGTAADHPVNWKQEYQFRIVNNDMRNIAITKLAEHLNGQTVVLVDRQDHGQYLAQVLNCPFIYGETSSKSRKILYSAFKKGDQKILVIGKLGAEGLDLPNIDNLILAGGGQAPHLTIQKVGRGMRTSEGKTHVSVFDFEDYGKYVAKHSRKRERTYEKESAYTLTYLTVGEIVNMLS